MSRVTPHRFLRAKSGAGFTLIETLFAVLMLAIAIAGPLTIASKALSSASTAKNRTTATFLAQDALEYVRYIRDTNRLAGATAPNWLTGSGGDPTKVVDLTPCLNGNACYLDTVSASAPVACDSATSCPQLYYDTTINAYTYSTTGTTRTPFMRTVTITTPVGTNASEALVTVVVSWYDAGGLVQRSVTFKDNLLNWQ